MLFSFLHKTAETFVLTTFSPRNRLTMSFNVDSSWIVILWRFQECVVARFTARARLAKSARNDKNLNFESFFSWADALSWLWEFPKNSNWPKFNFSFEIFGYALISKIRRKFISLTSRFGTGWLFRFSREIDSNFKMCCSLYPPWPEEHPALRYLLFRPPPVAPRAKGKNSEIFFFFIFFRAGSGLSYNAWDHTAMLSPEILRKL